MLIYISAVMLILRLNCDAKSISKHCQGIAENPQKSGFMGISTHWWYCGIRTTLISIRWMVLRNCSTVRIVENHEIALVFHPWNLINWSPLVHTSMCGCVCWCECMCVDLSVGVGVGVGVWVDLCWCVVMLWISVWICQTLSTVSRICHFVCRNLSATDNCPESVSDLTTMNRICQGLTTKYRIGSVTDNYIQNLLGTDN